jgi:hypothetical protein
MASTIQDKLYDTFIAVAGQQDSNPGGALDSGEEIAASLSDAVKQLGDLTNESVAQATSAGSASAARATGSGSASAANATGSSSTSAADTSSGGITAQSVITTVLESGMGMVPLIVGLLGLFRGGGTPAPPTLEKYAMPERLYFEGADTGSDVSGADYDQMGMPRAYRAAPDGGSARTSGTSSPGDSGNGSEVPSGPGSGGAPAGAAQITVNVQAMDSQSFLDHSNEIAQAVRAAMLNSNSINDVVNNL